ncbi:MAG: 50S ribosomal protein L29 [Candidatus Kuenenbacteria bacterium]
MKIKELRVKNQKELERFLAELEEKLRIMRFKVAQRQLKKVNEIKNVKRDIARVKAVILEISRKAANSN